MIEREGKKFVGGTTVNMDVTDIMLALGTLAEDMQTAASDEAILAMLPEKTVLEGHISYLRMHLNEYEIFLREGRMLEDTIESTINDAQRSISLAEKKIKT